MPERPQEVRPGMRADARNTNRMARGSVVRVDGPLGNTAHTNNSVMINPLDDRIIPEPGVPTYLPYGGV